MPYIPPSISIQSYRCPGCGHIYQPSMVACLVLHSPGSCCHCQETRLDGMSVSGQVELSEDKKIGDDMNHAGVILWKRIQSNNTEES